MVTVDRPRLARYCEYKFNRSSASVFIIFFTKKAGENLLDAIFSLDLSLNPREETVQKVGRNKRMFSLGV